MIMLNLCMFTTGILLSRFEANIIIQYGGKQWRIVVSDAKWVAILEFKILQISDFYRRLLFYFVNILC